MPKTCPKVSIIVPVYNVEKYIDECIKSIVTQTLYDIEIICVDDCGTDNSMAIVEKYAKTDKRIKILRHKKNSGLSASRNTGIEHSSAPYLMFCDSDDFYAPTMCQEMLNAIEKSGADIAMCGTNIIYETDIDKSVKKSDETYYSVKFTGTEKVTNDIINNCDVSSCNKIFKKEIFLNHDLKYPFGLKYEDAYIFYTYMLWIKKITFVNKKLYNYCRRTGSIMSQTFNKSDGAAIDHLKIVIEIFKYMNKHNKFKGNCEQFWKNIFIPYFNYARWHAGKDYQNDINKLAYDFVKKNYIPQDLGWYSNRIMNMIANNRFKYVKKYLFGVVAIMNQIDYKTIYIMGLPVYKIKYFLKYAKYYLFGIQFKIKHNDF